MDKSQSDLIAVTEQEGRRLDEVSGVIGVVRYYVVVLLAPLEIEALTLPYMVLL